MTARTKILHDVMVTMRDGVRLATDVYFPEAARGPPPILFYRTPYSKDEMARTWGFAPWFAAHGYIVVQQDCRGCYKSEGLTDFLEPEALDGLDTLRWIEAQPWGDADVGSWGTSWSGWTQTAMAVAGSSRLKTIVPMMSGSDAWSSSVRHAGALELRWIAWAFWHSAENTQAALAKTPDIEAALVHPEKRFQDWLRNWPIAPGETQLDLTPGYRKWPFELMRNEDRSPLWESPSYAPGRHAQALARVSALYISSWYDSYARGTPELYQAHRDAGGKPARLMMGGWLHGTQTVEQSTSGGVDLGPTAAMADYKTFLLRWFDGELKGIPPTSQAEAPVRIFVMGGGSGAIGSGGLLDHGGVWRDELDWPLARTEYRVLHLHTNGFLSPAPPAEGAAPREFLYDPADPVPTIGGSVSSLSDVPADAPDISAYHDLPHAQRIVSIVKAGGFDQRIREDTFRLRDRTGPLADRADVLVFETEPLADPVELTGSVIARLWVSTDAADTDFTAKLIDVYPPSETTPDGFALNLTDSILRLRYRGGTGHSSPVTPGEVYPIEIELYPTSNLFARGHRIRLDISSSNFPRFDRNPNTGGSPSLDGDTMIARNTVWLDADRPSHIVVPIIPAAG